LIKEGEFMKYFVVDAFTDRPFHGNPAGVCLADGPLEDSLMQQIAFENNLSETAFLFRREGYYDLRWFTPETEIDLCGHATLGSAFILMNYVDKSAGDIEFHTKSGVLFVKREGDTYLMDFPARKPEPCKAPDILEEALGARILETHLSRDLLVLLESEPEVAGLIPNMELLKVMEDCFGIIVTARGADCDFVSRYFAPNAGIAEDPVTGSSHCTLIPFWGERLQKTEMTARQLSRRGGELYCRLCGDRVKIGGTAALYLAGDILV